VYPFCQRSSPAADHELAN